MACGRGPQALWSQPMDTPDLDPIETPADGPDAEGGERIAKRLARAGLCSRRDAERWITEGRVAVNGTALASPAFVVRPGDIVQVDGKPIPEPEPTRLWRYHKPSGLVTTARDEKGRETVFDRMPPNMPRVVSVGRLDLTTEGLLLLTNDGELARFLEMPATGWTRRYRVRVFGEVDEIQLAALAKGPTIEGVKYGPVEAVLDRVQGRNAWLTVSIKEGKNREIRKVMDSLGLTVNRLIRVAYGPFQLGKLPEGEVEEVPRRIVKEQVARFFSGAEEAPAKPSKGLAGGDAAKSAPSRSGVGKVAPKPFDAKAGWAKAEAKAPARQHAPARYRPELDTGEESAAPKPSRAKAGWARPKTGKPGGEPDARPDGGRPDSARQDAAPARAAAGERGEAMSSARPAAAGKPPVKVSKAGWAKAAPKPGGTKRGGAGKGRAAHQGDDVAGARPATGAKPATGAQSRGRAAKPGADKPHSDKPYAGKPNAAKPHAGKPQATKPQAAKPSAGKPKPGGTDKPAGGARAERGRPEGGRPERGQAERGQAGPGERGRTERGRADRRR